MLKDYYDKIYIPLSDSDILQELPKCKIVKYEELSEIKNIEKLLPLNIDFCILLFEQKTNEGHWVSIFRRNTTIYFFDSYGYRIDKQLFWNDYYINKSLNQHIPFLSLIFNNSVDEGFTIYFNEYAFQDEKTNSQTCGRWCVLFIEYMLSKKTNDIKTFYNYIQLQLKRFEIKNKDLLVSYLIDI